MNAVDRRRRAAALTVGLVVGGGVLAGCGSGSAAPEVVRPGDSTAGVVTTAADGVQEVTLQTGDDYAFTPDAVTVTPGDVRLTVTNTATQLTHNFLFTLGAGPAEIAAQIPFLAPGQSETIEFAVPDPGAYPFECSFHTALGQVGTLLVSG